jgi:hypothetical protein
MYLELLYPFYSFVLKAILRRGNDELNGTDYGSRDGGGKTMGLWIGEWAM